MPWSMCYIIFFFLKRLALYLVADGCGLLSKLQAKLVQSIDRGISWF